jgi:hypothetical protein
MRNKLKYLLFILCLAFYACSKKDGAVSVFDAIPLNTAVVIESQKPMEFCKSFSKANYLSSFKAIPAFNNIVNQANVFDSISVGQECLFQNTQMAMAVFSSDSTYKPVWLALIGNDFSNSDLKKITLEGSILQQKKLGKIDFFETDSSHLCLTVKSGLLLMAADEDALNAVLMQLENPLKINLNEDFQKVSSTLGSSVNAHLYCNFNLLNEALLHRTASKYQTSFSEFLSRFRGLAALDILSKNDELILNGYSVADDSASSLRSLKYQQPVKNTVVNILPYNAKLMLHYGMSDFPSYWADNDDHGSVAKINQKYNVDIEKQLIENISELAFCIFDNALKPVLIARLNDASAVSKLLSTLSSKSGAHDTRMCQGYTLRTLNHNNFASSAFWNLFSPISTSCYSIVDQYLLLANDLSTLEEMISYYRSGRTLDLNENYKAFQNNMLETANISLFVAFMDNHKLLSEYVSSSVDDFFKQNKGFLNGFQAFSIQLAGDKNLVYTCACLRHVSDLKEENRVQWKTNLDAPLYGKPHIVADHKTTGSNVVVFDEEKSMYLIDSDGNILWKKRLEEMPISDVVVVDYYKNGKFQFLFNTSNYLFLIDRNGDFVDLFPVRLKAKASNGLAVFDYEGTKDYRILICGNDKFLYNYDIHGSQVEGWNRHRTDDVVTKPVEHLVADGKDFLIVTDVNGGIRILDRQGKIRIPLVDKVEKLQTADFYINKTNNKGVLLTVDKSGKLLYINAQGKLDRTDFGDYSNKMFFLYEDFNQDQDPDFIYMDGKKLKIFDRFKKDLFVHEFEEEIENMPVFFKLTKSKRLLGVVSEKAREIYLIDKNGNMIVSSGLVGETPFSVGSLHDDEDINLITGAGSTIFNYLIY